MNYDIGRTIVCTVNSRYNEVPRTSILLRYKRSFVLTVKFVESDLVIRGRSNVT